MSRIPTTRNRVLVVSFAFFPRPGAGHVRTQKFVKYLPSLGWDPTVLTEKLKGDALLRNEAMEQVGRVRVIEARFHDPFMSTKELLDLDRDRDAAAQITEKSGASVLSRARARLIKRMIRVAKDWVAFPDARITWAPTAVLAGYRELREVGYDAIYSTSPPATNHIVAATLKALTGLPWIADYRDLWSQDRLLDRSARRRKVERLLEKFVMRRADQLVTVGTPFAESLGELHAGKPVSVITNGFDPDDYPRDVEPEAARLVMTCTGNLYNLRCDPRPLMSVLDRLIERGQIGTGDVLLRFYTGWDPSLAEARRGMTHGECVEINGMVPRDEVLVRQRESSALVAFIFDEPAATSWYPSKVLEYMGAGRPVLAWAPRRGAIERLMEETRAGALAATEEDLERIIIGWAKEHKERGKIGLNPAREEIGRYSRERLTGDLAAIFNNLIEDSSLQ